FGWNFSVVLGLPVLLMYGGQAILVVLWLILIGVLIWDESRLTRIRLGDYANHGWLTDEEADVLATWKGRYEGKRWARQVGVSVGAVRGRLEGARHRVPCLSANRQEMLLHAR